MIARLGIICAQHHHQCVRRMALHDRHDLLNACTVRLNIVGKHCGTPGKAFGHHLIPFPQKLCHATGPAHLARITPAGAGHIAEGVGIAKAQNCFQKTARSFFQYLRACHAVRGMPGPAMAQGPERPPAPRPGEKLLPARQEPRLASGRRLVQSSSAIWFITAAMILISSI